jgi:hypothetical protein
MAEARLLFHKRDGDLAVEVRQTEDGHRKIELLRSYEKNGEWHVTNRLPYADHKRGTKLLQEAQKWIDEQDKADGKEREAHRPKEPGEWTKGLKYGQRRLLKAQEIGR